MPDKPTCSAPRCDRTSYARGLCQPDYNRAYREANRVKLAAYRANNAERNKELWLAWHEANREHRAAYRAAYNEANREQNLARYRAGYARNYATNPEALRARARAFAREHPEKVRAHAERRAARIRAQFVEKVRLDVLRERDGNMCGLCNETVGSEKGSIDHIKPIWRGGEHSYANTRFVHLLCNKRRGGKESALARAALKQH